MTDVQIVKSVACGVATSFGRCGSFCKIGTQRVSYRALYRALYTGGKRDKHLSPLERELFAPVAAYDAARARSCSTIAQLLNHRVFYPYSTE